MSTSSLVTYSSFTGRKSNSRQNTFSSQLTVVFLLLAGLQAPPVIIVYQRKAVNEKKKTSVIMFKLN